MTAVDAAAAPANHEAAASRGPAVNGPAARAPFLRHGTPAALLALAAAAAVFARHPLGAGAALAGFMAAVLVVVSATDIERRIIPNVVVLPAAALILLGHVATSPQASLQYLLAGLCAAAVFTIPNLIGRSWMGMGDVKLILLLGVGLGSGVLGALTIAFLSVFPFALAALVRGGAAARSSTLPFGPFLALGGLILLLVPHLAM
jgi:leader peptidase (prepilin peptidase)/N-methyltransferase